MPNVCRKGLPPRNTKLGTSGYDSRIHRCRFGIRVLASSDGKWVFEFFNQFFQQKEGIVQFRRDAGQNVNAELMILCER